MPGAAALAGVTPPGPEAAGAGASTLALGVDIVEVDRLRAMVGRRGEDLLLRLLTGRELAAARGARGLLWPRIASRVAAKEATKKALGSRGQLARWTEVEVYTGAHGEPLLRLSGGTRLAAARCGLTGLRLSLAHGKTLAIAVVVGW